jgi:hypothetical protein
MSTPTTTPACPLSNDLVISCTLTLLAASELHAKTEKSIANAVLGLLHSDRLSVTAIGTAWARVTGHGAKHGVKQVDRLASNDNFSLPDCMRAYVRQVIGKRSAIITALDWTEFAPDGQATICLSLATSHGRATPLLWKTVELSAMKERRNSYEEPLMDEPWFLASSLPSSGRALIRLNTEKRRTHSLLRQGREYIKGLVVAVAQALQARFIELFREMAWATVRYGII